MAVLLYLLFTFVQFSLQQSCYYPDGSIAKDDSPCTDLAPTGTYPVLPCCGPGKSCLSNGMCSSGNDDSNPARGSCTDQTWDSINCPQFCLQSPSMGASILGCPGGSGSSEASSHHYYCCAQDGPQCCNNSSLLFVADTSNLGAAVTVSGAASSLTTSSTTSSSTSSTTSSTTSSSSPTSSAASTSPSAATSTSQSASVSSSTSSTSSSPSSSSPSPSPSTSSSSGSSSTLSTTVTKANPVVTTTESKTDASTTSTSTTVQTEPTTTTATVRSEAKRDWTGVGIGVGIGVAVPLLALAIIGPLLWRRHRRKISRGTISPVMYPHDSASSRSTSTRTMKEPVIKPAYLYEAGGVPTYELDAIGERVELPMKSPRELPGAEGERQRYVAYRPPDW